jgi:preprotein translocase subunit SecF
MINIISKRYWFFLISALVIVPGLVSLIAFGLKPSNDFQPGTTMTLRFNPPVDESAVRTAVADAG